MSDLSDVAVITTACWRPQYLSDTLNGWSRARGFGQIRAFHIGLGWSKKRDEMRAVIHDWAATHPVPVHVHEDNPRIGPWRAIAKTGNLAFEDPGTQFLIVCDEDTLVADDVLELLMWERSQFGNDPRVLLVNAHSRCCQGWDGPDVKDDPQADPGAVRLLPYFNQWGWGTWRECWEGILIPDWDYDGSSGHPMQSGHDWQIALRTMTGYLAAVPDASRTQHIGDTEGMFSTPETLAWSKAASFRPHREAVTYRVEPARPGEDVQPTGAIVSVVVPTMGRAHKLQRVAANIRETTASPHEILMVAEPGDQATRDAILAIPRVRLILNQRKSCYAGAINTAASVMTGRYLFTGSDDLKFHPGWDTAVLSVMKDGVQVGGTNDLLHPMVPTGEHATHYLVSRSYITTTGGVPDKEPGLVLNEDYDHGCTDSEFIGVARTRGVFAPCLQSVVEHLHVEARKSPDDATYQRGRAHHDTDQALWLARQAEFVSAGLR